MAGRHRWDRPVFAALYDFTTGPVERQHYARWRAEVAGRAAGAVLEIGAGTGANLPFYPPGARLVTVEPNRYMQQRGRRKARALGRRVAFVKAAAESLPFADASFDVVVSTLVLCSVDDPAAAAREIWRVLRPGGTLRLLEHVRADSPELARWQDRITPLWRRLGAGCHPNRPTLATLVGAGFEVVEARREPMAFWVVRPHVVAVLRKPGPA